MLTEKPEVAAPQGERDFFSLIAAFDTAASGIDVILERQMTEDSPSHLFHDMNNLLIIAEHHISEARYPNMTTELACSKAISQIRKSIDCGTPLTSLTAQDLSLYMKRIGSYYSELMVKSLEAGETQNNYNKYVEATNFICNRLVSFSVSELSQHPN